MKKTMWALSFCLFGFCTLSAMDGSAMDRDDELLLDQSELDQSDVCSVQTEYCAKKGGGAAAVPDFSHWAQRAMLEGHGGPIYSVAFHPTRALLASASSDATIRCWDLNSSSACARLEGHKKEINTIGFSGCGSLLVSGASDCKECLWDVESQKKILAYTRHKEAVLGQTWVNLATIASTSWDGTVHFWDIHTGKKIWGIDLGSANKAIAKLSDMYVAVADSISEIVCIDTRTHKELVKFATKKPVASLAVNVSKGSFAAGLIDGTIMLSLPDNEESKIMHTDTVSSLGFSKGGKIQYSSSCDGTISFLNLDDKSRGTIDNKVAVHAATLSPDEKHLAAGLCNGKVCLWEQK